MDHDKMMQIIHDVFAASMPRLAPGDDESTRRALEMLYGVELESVGSAFRVLDIGCGNGAQTLRLAAELGRRVTAVDDHQPYLDELKRRAEAQGLAERIETRCADMKGLDLGGETFDLGTCPPSDGQPPGPLSGFWTSSDGRSLPFSSRCSRSA